MTARAEHGALRVHELERGDVVLLGVRRERYGLAPVHSQLVSGEELRVVEVEPERARRPQRQAAVILGDEDETVLLQARGHFFALAWACSAACASPPRRRSSASFSIAGAPASTRSSDCAVVMSRASSMKSATRR